MGAESLEEIIESFTHSMFPKQHREPNCNKIQQTHKLAGTDAASVEITRGGGQHGCLEIFTLTDAECYTLIGGTFVPPTNPGPTPTIEGGLVAVEIAMQQNDHVELLRKWKDCEG